MCGSSVTSVVVLPSLFEDIGGLKVIGFLRRMIRVRKIFGPSKDDITGDGRKFHSEGLGCLFSSPGTIEVIK
jgi:hypothetical protein